MALGFIGGLVTSSLESVWEFREEELYPSLFGEVRTGIFALEPELFTDVFGLEEYDPRWLHLGVFEFAPTQARNSWLYVTSGGSTPWDTAPEEFNPEEYSWLGVEFVLETPCKEEWAVRALQRLLTYHLMAAHGCFGDNPGVDYGHRVPAGGSVDGKSSILKVLAIVRPDHYPPEQQLASGKFDFLHVVGISEKERDYAKANGTEALASLLSAQGAFPVTDANRKSAKL